MYIELLNKIDTRASFHNNKKKLANEIAKEICKNGLEDLERIREDIFSIEIVEERALSALWDKACLKALRYLNKRDGLV